MTTSTTNSATSGSWSDPSDWPGGVLNGDTDRLVISDPGTSAAAIVSGESTTARNVTLDGPTFDVSPTWTSSIDSTAANNFGAGMFHSGTSDFSNPLDFANVLTHGSETLASSLAFAHGQAPPLTSSTWTSAVSGDWSDAVDWTGGVPNGNTANATIAVAGTYTVDIGGGESFTADNVTLNDAQATLEIDGTLNLIGTLDVQAGDLIITHAINGGTIDAASGPLTFNYGGILNGVTVEGTIDLNTVPADLIVTGGLTMVGPNGAGAGTINLSGGNSELQLSGTEAINNADINLGLLGKIYLANGTATLGPGTTVNHTDSDAYLGTDPTLGVMINDGSIVDSSSNGRLMIEFSSFTNAGSISVSGGDTFIVDVTSFSNSGSINIDGISKLEFESEVTTAELGTIKPASGATLDFAGTLNNTGAVFSFPTGAFLDGTIQGGTLEGTLNITSQAYPGQSVVLAGSPVMEGANGTGAATINLQGTNDSLGFSGTETINNVAINFEYGTIDNVGDGVVTLGSSVTIDQANGSNEPAVLGGVAGTIINDGSIIAALSGGNFQISPTNFTNAGTLAVSKGDTVAIYSTTFNNTGTISVDGTSAFYIQNEITTAELGTINAAAGATIGFDLNNAGATFIVPTGANIEGEIQGGTIEGSFNLTGANQRLTLAGAINMEGVGGSGSGTINDTGISSALEISGVLNNATINIGNATNYVFDASEIIGGGGTLGSTVTVNQSVAGAYALISSYDNTFTNDGTILAAAKGGGFTISQGTIVNAGVISVSNGDTLFVGDQFNDTNFTNTGTIKIDGASTVNFVGEVTTAQLGTISGAAGAILDFSGTLNNTGATYVVPNSLVLSGTIEGTLSVGGQSGLTFIGSPTFEGANGTGPGTIDATGGLFFAGTETVSNVGINLGIANGFGSANLNQNDSIVTFGPNVTITQIGTNSSVDLGENVDIFGTFVNDGAIVASEGGGARFTINPTTFDNAGTISIANGDIMEMNPTNFDNTGTISIDGKSQLWLDVVMTTAELGAINTATGAIIEFGDLVNTGATLVVPTGAALTGFIQGGTIEGTINLSTESPLTLSDGVSMVGAGGSGTGTINDIGSGTVLYLSGNGTFDNATINLGFTSSAGSAIVNLDGGVQGSVQTLGPALTIIQSTSAGKDAYLGSAPGSGNTSQGAILNEGSIVAALSGGSFIIDPLTFTNSGKVDASGGDTLTINPTSFTNLAGAVLTGGSYEADASSIIELANNATIVTDDATIILSGTGSTIQSLNSGTGKQVAIDTTLTTIGSIGTLELLAGRSWTFKTTISNAGTIDLGGGTLTFNALSNSGNVYGYGTIAASITNTGAGGLTAQAGQTLNLGALSNLSGTTLTGGTYGAGAAGTLQLANNVSIVTLDATAVLNGSGANIQSDNTTKHVEVTLQSSLTTIGSTGVLEVLGGGNYGATNAISNSGTIQLGGGTWQAGTLTDNAGSTLTGFGIVASTISAAGAVTASGGTLEFTASGDTFSGALGGQEIDFGAGADTLQSGSSVTASILSIYGNATVTASANETISGALKLGAGTLNVGANTLTLSGTGSTLAGTLSGTGTLAFSGGSQALNSGLVLSATSWTTSGNDAASINENLSYGGTFSDGAGTTLAIASGDAFTLTGTSTLAGSVTGAGTLVLSGGKGTLNGGASIASSALTISNGVTVTVSGNAGDAAATSQASGTTISIGSGNTLSLSGVGTTLAGTVSGAGTLALTGGSQTLASGATLSVASLATSGNDTFTLSENLSYAGALSDGAGTTLALGANSLTLTGASTIAGTVSGTGSLALTGGSVTLNSGANIASASFAISSGATVTVGGNAAASATTSEANGATISIGGGDTLSLSGSGSTLSGTVSGAGTLALTGGSQTIASGATLTVSNVVTSGSDALGINASVSYAGAFSSGAGTTATIGASDTLTLTGASTIAGTLSGAGTLALAGGSATLNTGANITSAAMTVASGASVTVAGNVTDSAATTAASGTTISIGSGDTLALSGTGSGLAGTISGAGTLALAGGTDTVNTGATLTTANLSIANGTVVTFGEALTYAGALSEASGATLALGANTLTLNGAGSNIAGTISGPGTLALTGGSQALNSGAILAVSNWKTSGSDAVSVNENLSYGGAFTDGAGTTLAIASGYTLTLSGTSTFAGAINGAGTLALSGGTDSFNSGANIASANLAISNGATVTVNASLTDSAVTSQASGTTLSIAGGAALSVSASGSSFAGTVSGAGTLALTGGSQTINSGAVVTVANLTMSGGDSLTVNENLAYSGTLNEGAGTTLALGANSLSLSGSGSTLAGTISGTGTLALTGGSQTLASGATFTVANWTMSGNDTFDLNESLNYAGKLSEGAGTILAVASGDTLTLTGASTIAGVINGGALVLSGGAVTLNAGASIATSGVTVSNAAAITVNGNASDSAATSFAAGTTVAIGSGDTLRLSGAGSTFADTVSGAGTLLFSGGSQTLNSGASLTVSNWTTSGSDAVTIKKSLTYAGTFSEGAGTSLALGINSLTLSGSGSSIAGAISGTQSLIFSGGSQTLNSGASLSVSKWTISGSDAANIDANLAYAGTFSDSAGATLSIASGDIFTLGGTSTFAGAVTGAGTFILSGGKDTFNAGATLSAANVAISNGASVTLTENLHYAGNLAENAGTTLALGARVLTLSGAGSSIAGTISGTGTLTLSGGSQTFNSGAAITVSNWTTSGADAASINESLSYGGKFSQGTGTSIAVASSDTFTVSGKSTFAGTISGAGTLALAGGSQTISSGAALTVSNWSISGSDTTTVNESLSYDGTFSAGTGTTVVLGSGDTLTVSGASTFGGTVDGGGTIAVSNGSLSGFVLGGADVFADTGIIHQTGQVTIGDSSANAATLSIASGGSYLIDSDSGIAIGASTSSTIDVSGLLIKDGGTATSQVMVGIVDNGAVEAGSGTLDVTLATTGSGTLKADTGAVLELDAAAAATLQMTFNGSDSTLALGAAGKFAATINGFAASDFIDLINTAATSATLETGDELLIKNGAKTVATLQLAGNYAGYTFSVASDGHGGTNVTTNAPGGDSFYFGGNGQSFTSNGEAANIFVSDGTWDDTFNFNGRFGEISVSGYAAGHDLIYFDHNDFGSIAAVEAHATQDSHGNTIISLDANDTITLVGVSLNQFESHASDWHFI